MSEVLLKNRVGRSHNKMNIDFSKNTVTKRWYRSPEVILLDHNYNESSDVWGIGCILAELIHCSDPYIREKNYNNKQKNGVNNVDL